ncbi:MAG: hypothetical protein V9G19_03450 [Tetrasphaera sp.]
MSLPTLQRRAWSRLTTPSGRLLIVAADQRNSMKAVMTDPADGQAHPDRIDADALAAAKGDLITHLASHAPAVLLDPEVALPRLVDDGTVPPHLGLVVGMDASGSTTRDGLRYTNYVDGVTPRTVRDYGGDAAKMLFYVRADQQGGDSAVAGQMRDLVAACDDEGVLPIVELLTYRLEDESPENYQARFPELVVEMARLGAAAGSPILKLPYAGSPEACAAVTEAVAGVPWAVLSAGVDHETFAVQMAAAVAAGASGAMAGRSLWKDSLSTSEQERATLLTQRALPRLRELAAILSA